MMNRPRLRSDGGIAALLAVALFVLYNSNGREIGSFDSQPTKYAARELLLRGTLTLNHVVGTSPQLLERHAFVLTETGRIRSAYSPVPSLIAATIAWPFWQTGLVDIRAPRAPNLIAVLTASLLTASAAALVFLTARRRLPVTRALVLAIALGVGTGFWHTVSQTLWQHETAIFGLSLAVFALMRPVGPSCVLSAVLIGVGLALAGTSRFQLSPAIAVLLLGTLACAGLRAALIASAIVVAAAGTLIAANLSWFGHPLGAMPLLLAQQPTIHRRIGSFGFYPDALGGLLVSPNRGMFVFSPIVLVAVAGIPAALRERWRSPAAWCAAALIAQYIFYGCYAIWWGGHTYGPRYLLDVLPLAVPAAMAALQSFRFPAVTVPLATAALVWSVTTAAIGAFYHPNGNWNADPADVDRRHARLWDWTDLQIVRCWRAGPSPQNFNLFDRSSYRTTSR
jgi:hypothetical protein